jgi:hypothetical protein
MRSGRRQNIGAQVIAWMVVVLGMAFVLLFILGSMRYGGTEGLVRRVRAQIDTYRPHPAFVPTPLPTPTPGQVFSQTRQRDASSSPAPFATLTPTQISSPAPSATLAPTQIASPAATPTLTEGPTGTPTPAHQPAAPSVELTGLAHAWQTWNNCGPATLAMYLSYSGSTLTQADVEAALRPDKEDKNVSPEELADFARSQGLRALVRVNGDAGRMRLLLSNGIPVLIETWLEPEPGNGMGHYRLLTGYDAAQEEWIAFDSYVSTDVDPNQPYRGIRLPHNKVDQLWAVFNRAYLLVYTDEQAPIVRSILGEDADAAKMWQRALLSAQENARQRPEDPFAWFNLGTDLVALGDFEQAAAAYDRARVIGLPWRMLWYQFGPFQAYFETGRFQEVNSLADATLNVAKYVEELCHWKGLALQATGDPTGARRAFERALALNPNYAEAAAALATLEE